MPVMRAVHQLVVRSVSRARAAGDLARGAGAVSVLQYAKGLSD